MAPAVAGYASVAVAVAVAPRDVGHRGATEAAGAGKNDRAPVAVAPTEIATDTALLGAAEAASPMDSYLLELVGTPQTQRSAHQDRRTGLSESLPTFSFCSPFLVEEWSCLWTPVQHQQ